MTSKYFTTTEWFSLKLEDRRRWWEITDYGRMLPGRRVINHYVALIEAAKVNTDEGNT